MVGCSRLFSSPKFATSNPEQRASSMEKLSSNISMSSSVKTLSSRSSLRSSFMTMVSFDEAIEDWMYWKRDDEHVCCWTKVYGVLDQEFFWLFKPGEKTGRELLFHIAVASVEPADGRMLRLSDPNGEHMDIWLLDTVTLNHWYDRLQEAAERTANHFRMSECKPQDLPRSNIYRGSLVTYRKVSKRSKVRSVWQRFLKRWKDKVLPAISVQLEVEGQIKTNSA